MSRAQCARRNEERVQESLSLFGRGYGAETCEVDELRAEAEDCFVEHVINLDDRAKTQAFRQTKLARHVEIEDESARTNARVAREVSGLADSRQREGREKRGIEPLARLSESEQRDVARKDGTVVGYVVEIAINAADGDVEGCARCKAHDGRDTQASEP